MAKEPISLEVELIRRLEASIVWYMEEAGYGEGTTLDDDRSQEIRRAVAWLASKYGD